MLHSLYRLSDATDENSYIVSLLSFDRRKVSEEEVRGRSGVVAALLGIMARTGPARSPEVSLRNALQARAEAAAQDAALALLDELGVPQASPTRHETLTLRELRHRQADQALREARQLMDRLELWHGLVQQHQDGADLDFDAVLSHRDVLAMWPESDRSAKSLTVADAIWDMVVSGGGSASRLMSSTWRVRIDVVKKENPPA